MKISVSFNWVLFLFFSLLVPIVCYSQNFNYDRLDSGNFFFSGSSRPLPLSAWVTILSIWVFPFLIAKKKESQYGKDGGLIYWKWVGIFLLVFLISMGSGWFGFLLMICVFCAGFFWRSKDEYVSDVVSSVKKVTELQKLNSKRGDETVGGSDFSHGSEGLTGRESDVGSRSSNDSHLSESPIDRMRLGQYNQGMTYMISGRPHRFNGFEFVRMESDDNKNDHSSNVNQSSVQQTVDDEPQIYSGGMIFMISGSPHQFNGDKFERVDTDKSVVINGVTFIWNGQNFVNKT
jgi:hypothetical protein